MEASWAALKSSQQFVQGLKHLLRQAFADVVLELPAAGQERRKALIGRHSEQTLLVEQFAHSGAYGTTCGLAHISYSKVQPPGAFAAGCGDASQCRTVEQETRRYAGVAQQAFEAGVRRGFQAAERCAAYLVEVGFSDFPVAPSPAPRPTASGAFQQGDLGVVLKWLSLFEQIEVLRPVLGLGVVRWIGADNLDVEGFVLICRRHLAVGLGSADQDQELPRRSRVG